MLIDELREKLKEIEPELETIKSFYKNNKIDENYQKLEETVNSENFWQNPDNITISKEHQRLKIIKSELSSITKAYQDSNEFLDLFEDNEDELNKLKQDTNKLCKQIRKFKIEYG